MQPPVLARGKAGCSPAPQLTPSPANPQEGPTALRWISKNVIHFCLELGPHTRVPSVNKAGTMPCVRHTLPEMETPLSEGQSTVKRPLGTEGLSSEDARDHLHGGWGSWSIFLI